MPGTRRRPSGEAGIGLVEVLAALAITGLLATLLLPFATQVLGNWTRGSHQGEADEQLMRAGLRLQAEIAAAAPLPLPAPGRETKPLAFIGRPDTCQFVIVASDEAGRDLRTVAFSIDEAPGRSILVRRMGRFDPDRFDADPRGLPTPVAVIDGRYAMRFVYIGQDGVRRDDWTGASDLPARIELSVKPLGSRQAPMTIVLMPIS